MLGFFFERIAHATADVLPARELNDRAALSSHFCSADTRTPPEGLTAAGVPRGGVSGTLLAFLLTFMDDVLLRAPQRKYTGVAKVPHGTSGTNSP